MPQAACVLSEYAGVDVDLCSSSVEYDLNAALNEPPASVLLRVIGTSLAMAEMLLLYIQGTRQIAGIQSYACVDT